MSAKKATQPAPMVQVDVVQLTPELAKEYLDRNENNYRDINPRRVVELTEAMRRGEFSSVIPSNDAIAFADNGTLLNGQHRCLAVVRSEATIAVLVLRGGSVDSADNMDTGGKRNAATVLKRHGFTNPSDLASTSQNYHQLVHGFTGIYALTNPQVLAFVEKYETALREATRAGKRVQSVGVPRGMASALYFAAGQHDPDKASEFFVRLNDGIGLYPGNPIHTLRSRALVHAGKRHSLDRVYMAAIMIKSWNAWFDRRALKVLKWRGEQSPNEPFPTILSSGELVLP